jgi:F-type H+-transporting ATPase subunit delta
MTANRKAKRTARQLFRLCVVDGRLDDARARRVGRRLAASPRRGSLAILTQFQRLVRLDRDRHTAFVESAVPLDGAERARIAAELAGRYGAGLATAFAQNPALIAGVRIKVGSDVYDGSVRGGLAALDARL